MLGFSTASAVLCLFTGLASGLTSTLQQVTNFGSNPTNVRMFVYRPTTVKPSPAVIVAIHYCGGTAQAYFTGSPYASLADTNGFIVIYPSSPQSCWDVSSKATLTHNGGGNSNSIANMVTFAINTYGADPSRIFVTGSSSGAMMTNVMAATYPNLFKAASVYSGVAAGCFVSSSGGVAAWNSTCANGQSVATQQQWANVVKGMFPGYTGTYPAIQEYHGTADTTLFYLKPRRGAPVQVLQNTPASGYTKSIYGPNLQGISGQGVGHTVPIMGAEDLKWFGITGGGVTTTPSVPTSTPATTTTSPTTSPTSPPTGGTVAHWDQCGGQDYQGATVCVSPFTCQVLNRAFLSTLVGDIGLTRHVAFYSQCL
ncbi:carbohydrate esterase family 1 and carbohydrate-binding module family 1 protein [Mycena rebaudengoi]|nr:carbohydrate esterase family 1 and carbohydrate-binding module family 1 protein [Mycena rebaudengoi]